MRGGELSDCYEQELETYDRDDLRIPRITSALDGLNECLSRITGFGEGSKFAVESVRNYFECFFVSLIVFEVFALSRHLSGSTVHPGQSCRTGLLFIERIPFYGSFTCNGGAGSRYCHSPQISHIFSSFVNNVSLISSMSISSHIFVVIGLVRVIVDVLHLLVDSSNADAAPVLALLLCSLLDLSWRVDMAKVHTHAHNLSFDACFPCRFSLSRFLLRACVYMFVPVVV